jgi:hypothetical protein
VGEQSSEMIVSRRVSFDWVTNGSVRADSVRGTVSCASGSGFGSLGKGAVWI